MCLRLYNDLKFAVQNCSYVCTNLILDHMISPGKEAFELRSLQLSGFLSAHPSNYQLIYPPTSLSVIHPLILLAILPPTYHPTYPPTHQSICHSFISSSTHPLPVHLPSIHSFIHPPIPRSISSHPSTYPTYLPSHLPNHPPIHLSSILSFIHPPIRLPICLSIHLSTLLPADLRNFTYR